MGAALPAPAQDSSNPPYAVTDLGPYYRVWQRSVLATDGLTGEVTPQVQGYTELGDGMNYWTTNGAQGQWAQSQDLIEITPTGAQAVHGQMTAKLSGDITAQGAITLTTPSGQVFQSHPIGLFYDDPASGKVAQIALVQASQGLLYAPNVIVFTNVLSSPNADLMLVWAKNGFEQNLVLKQAPPTPESYGLSSASSRLQLWTAMDQCPDPLEDRPALLPSGLVDHILIFSECWFPIGSAFLFGSAPLPSQGQATLIRPLSTSDTNAVPTAKSLATISGQKVVIEEINYNDLLPAFQGMSHASLSPSGPKTVEFAARAELLPGVPARNSPDKPILAASGAYTAPGVMLDYAQISGSTNAYTFTSGTTYCISNTFTVGPGLTSFQGVSCIKFATNAYLMAGGGIGPCTNCSGPMPDASQMAVLTSVDDNAYGAKIDNNTNVPNFAAAKAIWMYYNPSGTTLQNLLVRWAQIGIRYDESTGTNATISSSVFQYSQTGVYVNMPSGRLSLSSDTACQVATPVSNYTGTVSGSMTTDCGVVSVVMINNPTNDLSGFDTNKNSQSEPTFVLLTNSQTIVAAFTDTHLSEFGLGSLGSLFTNIHSPREVSYAVSGDGGTTFPITNALPPTGTSLTNAWQGDAGNPVLAYDPGYPTNSAGTVYLLANPSREPSSWAGFRLWTSLNKGTNFTLVNTNVPGGSWGVTNADKSMLTVNTNTHAIYVAGHSGLGAQVGLWAAWSTNGGTNWYSYQLIDTNGHGPDIVITSNGTPYVFWLSCASTGGTNNVNGLYYAWLASGGGWNGPSNFLGANLHSTGVVGNTCPLRFNGDDSGDWFEILGIPRAVIANGHIYVVYMDFPTNGPATDHGDIWVAEAAIKADQSLAAPVVRRVNNDGTATDQWNPSIAVRPGSTEIFIGYYSRQDDPFANSWIRAYGAKGDLANGLANTTFDCFPISPRSFPPLFCGTNAPASMQFDPIFAWSDTSNFCFDASAVILGCFPSGRPISCPCATNGIPHGGYWSYWFQDDYTWADADSSFFYFAWCDRSRTWSSTFGGVPYSRPDADVKFAKIRP